MKCGREPRLLLLRELFERVCHRLHRGQGIAQSKPRVGRHLGLVVSELAARFYPAGLDPSGFLAFYAERFSTVELNTTGYRLPGEEQFRRWAEQVPDGFEFAPKLPGERPGVVAEFESRVRHLGDRLGPVRISLKRKRDEGMLELLLGSLDPSLRLAFDLEHPTWDGIEPRLSEAGVARVGDLDLLPRSATSAAARRRTRHSPHRRGGTRARLRLLPSRRRAGCACARHPVARADPAQTQGRSAPHPLLPAKD